MAETASTEKIYCFVDETGQDTGGRLFFVSVVVVGEDRQDLVTFLEECEVSSGRRRGQKWMKSTHPQRLAFLRLAFDPARLRGALFYQEYRDWSSPESTYRELSKAVASNPVHKGGDDVRSQGRRNREKSLHRRVQAGRSAAGERARQHLPSRP